MMSWMTRMAVGATAVIAGFACFAANVPLSFAEAKAIWLRNKNSTEYQAYASEFSQFNNHFHLDERDGCYTVGQGAVNLMLVITHSDKDQFAVIENVLADVDNAKARCFEKTYRGIQTKVPPVLPFVLQMTVK